ATGLDTPIEASELHNAGLATKLLTELDLDAVVLTLDKHGALLEERGSKPIVVSTIARDVYDVTGAGDIVLAALAGERSCLAGRGALCQRRSGTRSAGLRRAAHSLRQRAARGAGPDALIRRQ